MRRMAGARAEVHEKGPIGSHGFRVLDELQGLIGQVSRQVVAFFRSILRRGARLVDRVVIVDQVWIPVVGLGTQEAVEALEATSHRPVTLAGGHVHLILGAQMPLAEHIGVETALAEHLGDVRALERDMAVGIGKADRRF